MLTRRSFIKTAFFAPLVLNALPGTVFGGSGYPLKEARYYENIDHKTHVVACKLCPRGCMIPEGGTGFCRARKNMKGKLYTLGYAQPCAIHIDPIEKKPFFNVLTGSLSFSIASAGCNLRCKFCQNWQISQASPLETDNLYSPPDAIVSAAKGSNCKSIAYTYTEPTNFYEYMLDTAMAARKRGILNVSHSNGYINPEPLKELCKYLDAVNIDMKGFSEDFYNRICEGELKPVLETIKTLKRSGVWVEITNLVIPGYNDDQKMIAKMCEWLKNNAGIDTPIHFSRFHPMYRLTGISPTPVTTLEKARETALKAGFHYVYVGNVPGHPGENTYCPKCRKILIKRAGYNTLEDNMKSGRCKFCNEKIGGIWNI